MWCIAGTGYLFGALKKASEEWSLEEEDSTEVSQLMGKIKMLAQSGLSIVEVMAISIVRGVQPL